MAERGLPDIDALASYGGPIANAHEVEDPTTDESADFRNLYAMNVAAMTHVSERAIVSFVGDATMPSDPGSGFVHDSVWGDDNLVKPGVTHAGTGIYDITWDTTVTDELEVVHTLNFRRAKAQVEQSDGVFRDAHAKVTGPNTIRIYTYLGTVLNDLVGEVITAWVY